MDGKQLAGVAGLEPATPGFGDLNISSCLVLDGAVCAETIGFLALGVVANTA